MIKITTSNPKRINRIIEIMEAECLHNPNIGNAEYTVELDDFDSIDGIDEIIGAVLMSTLFDESCHKCPDCNELTGPETDPWALKAGDVSAVCDHCNEKRYDRGHP